MRALEVETAVDVLVLLVYGNFEHTHTEAEQTGLPWASRFVWGSIAASGGKTLRIPMINWKRIWTRCQVQHAKTLCS